MPIDPRIPLMGQQPNFLATIGQANQMAAQQNEAQHQNAFRQFMQESGPGVFRGETAALEGLSRFDPNAAFSIKAQQERLQLARAAGARAAANARVSAEQKEKAARDYQMLRSVALARENGPEAFNQALATTGLAASGVTAENFDVYLATADGMAGELFGRIQSTRPEPQEPTAGMRDYQFAKENPDYLAFLQSKSGPLVDFSGANFGPGEPGGNEIMSPRPVAENPPTGAQEAFGLEGFVKGGANTVTDFLGFGEAFPNAAEQTRFFKNLEEDMLVGLSQAYGRQPAQALMERLRSLLPNAGTSEGSARAFGELTAMEDRFRQDLVSTMRQIESNPRMTQSDRQQLFARQAGLNDTLNRIQEARMRFLPPQGDNTTSGGVKWRIVE